MFKRNAILIWIVVFLFLFILFSTILNAVQSGPGLIENTGWQWNLTAVQRSATVFGDIDIDGDLDLALMGSSSGTGYSAKIYINNGTSLEESEQWQWNLTAMGSVSTALGDIDNDGYLDLIATGCTTGIGDERCSGHTIKFYINNGTSLEENESWQWNLTAVYQGAVNFGDVDNDGDLDLALIGCSASHIVGSSASCDEDEAKIYLSNGTSLEENEQWQANLTDIYQGNIAFGDADRDGDLDLVLTGRDIGGIRYTDIYLNNGTSFVHDPTWSQDLVAVTYSSPAWGDYDNDGDLDLIVMGFTDSMYVYENNGTTFLINQSNTGGILGGTYDGSLTLGDYSNNGYLDLVYVGSEEHTAIHYSVMGQFENDRIAGANLTDLAYGTVAWADVDMDDDLDLLLTGKTDLGAIHVHLYISNQSETYANTPPEAPVSGFQNYSTADGFFFGWGEGNDTETNGTGLYYNLKIGTTSGGHEIVSGVYGGGEDNGYFGNMMQRRNITLKNTRFTVNTTYYWSVQTIDTALNGSNWSEEQIFITTPDIVYPEITLDYPSNFYNQSSSTVTFNFTVVEENINTCELYGNWTGEWHVNQTLYQPPTSTTTNFTDLNIEEGIYIWNVMCNDSTDNRNLAGSNYTLIIDQTEPLISLEDPLNNTVNSTSNDIDFLFNVSDVVDVANCSLIINDAVNATATNIEKDITQNMTVFLYSGNYNWTINCTDTLNNFNGTFTYNLSVIDGTVPSVTLDYPTNNLETSDTSTIMNFTVVEVYPDSCDLYGNWSSNWHLNQTYTNPTTDTTTNFTTLNLEEGAYIWNVECNDTTNNKAFATSNFTLRVDITQPTVNIVEPSDLATYSSSAVSFFYNVSDLSSISNCKLIINESVNSTETSITKDTDQYFNVSLYNAAYRWSVNCTDGAGNVNASESFDVVISCTESWSCGSWSTCSGGTQTRICTQLSNCLTQASRPSESQSCSVGGDGGGGGGGGAGGGAGGGGGGAEFDIDFSIYEQNSLTSSKNIERTLTFDGQTTHTITFKEIGVNYVILVIKSEPLETRINVGETKNLDFNNDGINDFSITLNSIDSAGRANVLFKKLEGAETVAKEELSRTLWTSETEIRRYVVQGETAPLNLTLKNLGTKDLNINLVIENIDAWISINSFTLMPNRTYTPWVKLISGYEQEQGIYTGTIKLITDKFTKEIPLIMEVVPKKALFDVKVSVPSKFKKVFPGEEVYAEIHVLNIGKTGQVDVLVDRMLVDKDKILTSASESLGIEAVASFIRSLTVPEDILPGEYEYFVNITYKKMTAEGKDNFKVVKKIPILPAVMQKRFYEMLIWVVGGLALLLAYYIIRERHFEKEEKRDYNLIKKLQEQIKKKKKL